MLSISARQLQTRPIASTLQTATKIEGVVPAQTPVLLRVKGRYSRKIKSLLYIRDRSRSISNNLLKGGEYADAGKTGTINDLYDGGTYSMLTVGKHVCIQHRLVLWNNNPR